MVIHINPNRINVSAGLSGRTGERRRMPDQQEQRNAYAAPKRADINYIPAQESLRTLIAGAVDALRKGVYWDRGTILNLLV